jgi:hypothetical protein
VCFTPCCWYSYLHSDRLVYQIWGRTSILICLECIPTIYKIYKIRVNTCSLNLRQTFPWKLSYWLNWVLHTHEKLHMYMKLKWSVHYKYLWISNKCLRHLTDKQRNIYSSALHSTSLLPKSDVLLPWKKRIIILG